jgi:hypothetical protein
MSSSEMKPANMSAKENLGGRNSENGIQQDSGGKELLHFVAKTGYSLKRALSELNKLLSRLRSIVYDTVSKGCLAWKDRLQKVNILGFA